MAKKNKPIATVHIGNGIELVESYDSGKKLFNELWNFHKNGQTNISITFGHKLFVWASGPGNKRMWVRCSDPTISQFDTWDKLTGEVVFNIKSGQIIITVKNIIKCA